MKKIFFVLLAILMFLPLSLWVNAIDDDYSDPAIDLPDADASLYSHEFESYDPLLNSFVATEGVDVEDPLDAPENNTNVSTYSLKDTMESTDVNIELEALTQAQLDADIDGTRFKNIVNVPNESLKNRTYLFDKIATAYASCVPEENLYLNMQGSCNDGEYVYYSFFVGNRYETVNAAGKTITKTDPVGVCILAGKFNESGEFITHNITYSTELLTEDGANIANELKHGNDIAYNSLRDELIIVCCQKGYHNRIYKFDAAYFRDQNKNLSAPRATQIDLSCMITGLAYNEKMNKYVGAVSGDIDQFVIFDSDFNIIASSDGNDGEPKEDEQYEGLARQCLACDDNYIYATYHISNTADLIVDDAPVTVCDVIGVFTWDGTLVCEINLDINKFLIRTNREGKKYYNFYEIEGITFIDGKVLLGFNCYYGKNNGDRIANFYQYDLSNEFFSIKYCPDDVNVTAHINNDDLITQNVLHGHKTKTYTNTFVNNGMHFKGWYLYSVNSEKWRCHNKNTNVFKWLKENEIKDGFEKYIYPEHANVTQTASKGNQVLFCAAWEDAENKFYVSFDSNGGKSGTMPQNVSMTYGGSNQLPKNSFEKEIENYNDSETDVVLSFQGWNAYYVEGNKWYYKNSDGSHKAWYIEGEQPEGYVKCVYYDEATISKTTAPGRHIKMFALWNEFTIYYDSNGQLIKKDNIIKPQTVVYNNLLNIKKYTIDDIDGSVSYSEYDIPVSLRGYNQYLIEKNLWRYVNDGSSYWAIPSENAELYCFTKDSVSKGVGYGQHIVFKAVWNY